MHKLLLPLALGLPWLFVAPTLGWLGYRFSARGRADRVIRARVCRLLGLDC